MRDHFNIRRNFRELDVLSFAVESASVAKRNVYIQEDCAQLRNVISSATTVRILKWGFFLFIDIIISNFLCEQHSYG